MWYPSVFNSGLRYRQKQWHIGSLSIILPQYPLRPFFFLGSQAHITVYMHMSNRKRESDILSHGHRYHTGGFYHTFNKGTDLRSYSPEKLREKNQYNYSEKNDFCYKCRSSGVPSLNCMGRAWLYTGISVIIMSANSYRHEEECGWISFSPLTDLALWACCRVESSSLCRVGTAALHQQPLAPLSRLTQNPEGQKSMAKQINRSMIINRASLIPESINSTYKAHFYTQGRFMSHFINC